MKSKHLLLTLLMALLVPWAASAQTSLWSEDFEDGSMPTGWTTDGSGSWTVGTGDYSTSTGAGHGSYNAMITHGSTGAVTKLITPEIDLSSVNSAELSFMHVQRSWAGDIDQLKVYYRTSSSDSWHQLVAYTTAFASWTTESGIVLPTPNSTYQLAFEFKDNYGYGVGVDNIVIVPGASCPTPAGIVATPNGQNVTLTWASDATSFDVAYSMDASATPADNIVATVSTPTCTLNDLTLDVDHYFWVRANCSGTEQSDWSDPASVHLGYCVPAPSSVDGNGISNVTFGIGENVVNNNTPKATYADYHNLVGAVNAGIEATIAITFQTGYTYNTYVWVDLDNSLSFDSDEVICYGESTSSNPTTLTLNFTIPATQTLGDFRMRIGSADSGLGYNPANANPCYTSTYGCFQDYTLRVLEVPSCLPVSDVAVSNITAHEATITWTSAADAWQICVNDDEENLIDVTATTYNFTGLDGETTYTIKVRTNCGDDEYSDWTTVNFTTDIACHAPTNLYVDDITRTSAVVYWTGEGNFVLQYGEEPDAILRGAELEWITIENATSPQALTGLTPSTDYAVRVKKVCGGIDGESVWTPSGFTTDEACPAPFGLTATPYAYSAVLNWQGTSDSYTVSYRQPGYEEGGLSETFDNTSPAGWMKYSGLVDDVVAGTATLSSTSSGWIFTNTNVFGRYHAKVNIYGTSCKYWLVTPEVTPSNGTFTFDLALTDFNSEDPIEDPTAQADDRFVVLVYADSTWTILREWNNSGSAYVYNTIATAGEAVSIDLSAYVGQTVKIAFYGESTVTSNGDNDLHIDNVVIGDPQLIVEDWQTVTVDEAPATITGLTPGTTYEWNVQGDCGEWGTSEESATMTFTTSNNACPVPTNLVAANVKATTADLSWNGSPDVESFTVRYRTPGYYVGGIVEGFESGSMPAGWTQSGNGTWTVNEGYGFLNIPAHTGTYNAIINHGTTGNETFLITPMIDLSGETNPTLSFWYINYDWSGDINEIHVYYRVDEGEWVELWNTTEAHQEWTEFEAIALPNPSANYQIGFKMVDKYGRGVGLDDIVIGNPIFHPAGEWQTASTTETNITLTDLTPETAYEAQVKSDCSDPEEWSNMVSFTTKKLFIYTLDIAGFGGGNISWYLISSPIGDVNPTNVENMLRDNPEEYDLYAFDQAQPQEEWQNYKDSNFIMEAGKGYLYANQDNVTLTFTSEQSYTGNGEVTLVKDDAAHPDMLGWNLVGNPFGETAYIDRPFYVMNPQQRWEIIPATSNAIQPMQGIFVHAEEDGETMTFSTTPMPAKSANLALNLSQNSNVVDRAIVRFDSKRNMPKLQLNGNSTEVYIPMDGKDYAVVSAGEMGELPVSFKAESNGNYTMSFTAQEVSFSYLHLIDNMTGEDVDLLANPSYSFNAQTTDYASRFRLVFATGSSVDGDSFGFINGAGNLSIFGIEGEATVQVVDVLGHVLSSETFSGSYERKLDVAPGVYMVRLIQGNDVKVQKMVIK